VIDASESVAAHCHRDALKKQRLSFLEEIVQPVYERKHSCRER
jgi:hypothetical protein